MTLQELVSKLEARASEVGRWDVFNDTRDGFGRVTLQLTLDPGEFPEDPFSAEEFVEGLWDDFGLGDVVGHGWGDGLDSEGTEHGKVFVFEHFTVENNEFKPSN